MNAIDLENVSKSYRRYSGSHFAPLNTSSLQRSLWRDLRRN